MDCHAGCPRYAEYCVRLEAARQQRERERRVVSAIISGKPQYVKVGPYWKAGQTRLLSIHEVVRKMIVCNRDCFNCPYPDVPEECLSQPLTYAERRNLDWIEAEIINPKTAAAKEKSCPAEGLLRGQ